LKLILVALLLIFGCLNAELTVEYKSGLSPELIRTEMIDKIEYFNMVDYIDIYDYI